jgi:hypothetical protein
MGVIKTIVAGLGTSLRKPRLLLILYAVNLVFAGLVAVPLLVIVQQELGSSLLGLSVRPIDPAWLGEAALEYGSALPALLAALVAAGLVYLLLHIFLNGGIVGRLLDREGRAGLAEFAADGGRYFGRYLRLFLLGLVFYFLTLGLFMDLVGALFEPLSKSAVTEWPPLILSNLHLLIALLLLSIVHMVLDYSRIAVAADGDRSVLRALRHALGFLRKRFFRAWAVYLLIVVLTLAGTVLFYALFGRLGDPSTGRVAAGLAWMQIYIVFRIWIRTLFVAAQAEFYKAHPY